MQEKVNGSHVLGFDLTEECIKVAVLSGDADKPKLEGFFEIPVERDIEQPANVKPLYTDEQKKLLLHLIEKNIVVTAIPPDKTLVRPLEIKLKKEHDIDAALYFQAEPFLPYPIENAVVDRIIVNKTKDGSTLTVAAARKDTIIDHIHRWESFDIEPEVVSCVPQALAQFCGRNQKLLYCIHIENAEITCALIEDGKLLGVKTSDVGINQLYHAFIQDHPRGTKEAFGQLDLLNLDTNQYPSLSEKLEQLSLEATRLCYSHTKRLKGGEVDYVIVTGELSLFNGFEEYLAKKLEKNLVEPEERNLFKISVKEQKKYAIPIGLALTALNGETNQINFRQKELSYPNPWKRIKAPILTYFALSCLLSLTLYLMTLSYIDYKKDQIKVEYAELLAVAKKPYDQFETEFATINKKNSGQNLQITPLAQLSLPDIRGRLNAIDTQLKETPVLFPLFPNVPKVSDVLAWLSSNEITLGTKDKNGETNPQIELEKFSYKMVKRPEKSKLSDKYQVKVDLEFSATSPSVAREFHDFLMVPNAIIDPTLEIKWSTSRGKYTTSFYLKDKTLYQAGVK